MKELIVDYRLNGVTGTYYVSVTKIRLPFFLIRSSIVRQVKDHLQIKPGDDFKVLNIRENVS